MRRRAPRASFVVTFALAATAIASGCGGKENGPIFNNPPGPSSDGGDSGDGNAECPAEQPAQGTPCDLPSSASCSYADCYGSPSGAAVCQQGTWRLEFGSCNPPAPVYDSGPVVYDSGPDVRDGGPDYDAGPDVHDGGPDGEGQDGGHD